LLKKRQKSENWRLQNKQIIGREKLLKKWQKIEKMESSEQGNNRKRKIAEKMAEK
jgi:hypothetical protein